jgi:hypothetical protein
MVAKYKVPLLLLTVVLALTWALHARADTKLDAETMKAALRTVTIEEEGFIAMVVKKAHDGVLPPALVDEAFQWARKKPKHRFQYFKKALIMLAADQGISL